MTTHDARTTRHHDLQPALSIRKAKPPCEALHRGAREANASEGGPLPLKVAKMTELLKIMLVLELLRGSVLLCIPSSWKWKWRMLNGGSGPPRSWLRPWLVIGSGTD